MVDTSFIEDLASSSPFPGGGGASAYCGALGASLASMVANLTLGKKKYADVEAEVLGVLARLSILRSRLIELIDADAVAFEPLSIAYSLPSGTESEKALKNDRIQEALPEACDVPLEIMRVCIDVLHECDFIAKSGSRLAISDAGASALMSQAAVKSASLNVYINADLMDDAEMSRRFMDTASDLIAQANDLADGVVSHVCECLGIAGM